MQAEKRRKKEATILHDYHLQFEVVNYFRTY